MIRTMNRVSKRISNERKGQIKEWGERLVDVGTIIHSKIFGLYSQSNGCPPKRRGHDLTH